jgi:hypothetical protein
MGLQVTFDSADPHALNRFWAVALGYRADDHHDMISGLIEAGQVDAGSEDVEEVDGRRRWRDYASITPTEPGDGNRLLFQRVAEPKTAENRVHLDLHPGAGERDEHVERLIALGATYLWEASVGPQEWVTLADPEGNEFCVS